MPIIAILTHTPLWVWVLFAFLLYRGIKALQPREMSVSRMLILPLIFLAWAFIGIFTELPDWPVALAAFAGAMIAGLGLGWANAQRGAPASLDPATGLIRRPGSATTLVLVLVGFAAKYALSVALAMQPHLGAQTGFAAIFGGISGLIDGAFWGGAALQFRQAFARPQAA